MKKFETKLVTRLALALTLGAGLALASVNVASASSAPRTAHSDLARSHMIQFSGEVTSYTAASSTTTGSITLADRAGATLTFVTSATTSITEIGGSGAALAVNDFATVQALAETPGDAAAITFSAAAPLSFSGIVTAYTPASGTTAGSITLLKRNEASLTYSVTSGTTISENGGGDNTIAVNDFASIKSAAADPTVALAIAFDAAAPIKFTGRVTAYTAASGTATGSITLKDAASAELSFVTSAATVITESGGTGDTLAVGDHATVEASASAKTDATSITFIPAPPVEFYGQVTAYTAPSGTTAGSITLVKRNSNSATFSVTSTTVITEVGGSGDTLMVGDNATVVATSALPTTARIIKFTPAPRPVFFSGRVTAYTAASGTTDGSITIRRRDRAMLTYTITSSTVFTEVGGSGETIAVRDLATVEAAGSAKTLATVVTFRPVAEVGFFGEVTAYTAASGTTAGSITLVNRAGASLTFSTSSTTVITEVGGTGGTLSVGDYAAARAAAAAKSDALSITFSVRPPIVFSGRVSAYTAASGTTNGSLTLRKGNGASLTYTVTSTTTITEINGIGNALAAGDYAIVVALPSSPSVAVTITYRIHR
ncbi:MAG: hypothetical protein ACRDVC_10065 [Acidimicrobiales bacterium]